MKVVKDRTLLNKMKFTSLTTHVASQVSSQPPRGGVSGIDAAAELLDLSKQDLSFPTIELRIGEIADGLRSLAARPFCEEVLGKSAILFGLNPRQILLDVTRSPGVEGFIDLVYRMAPLQAQPQQKVDNTISIPGRLSSESERRILELAERSDVEVSRAVTEALMLTFLTGTELDQVVDEFKTMQAHLSRPEVIAPNARIAGRSIDSLFAARVGHECAAKLRVLRDTAEPLLSELEHPDARDLFLRALARPGLLLFNYLLDDERELRAAILPYLTLRDFLTEATASHKVLRAALGDALSTIAASIDQLMLVNEKGEYEASALRPDSMVDSLRDRLSRIVLLATGHTLAAGERRGLEALMRQLVQLDPVYGGGLARAFSIPYPRSGERESSVLTLKVFPEIRRDSNVAPSTHHLALEVSAPEHSVEEGQRRAKSWALAARLEQLVDELEGIDRFTPLQHRERAAHRALLLVDESFSSFEWLTEHGRRAIRPEFELASHYGLVRQFGELWHALSQAELFVEGAVRRPDLLRVGRCRAALFAHRQDG
jgi:hypothetical protein